MVFAWRHLRLRVDVLCYNALYLNYRYRFHNTPSVEVRRPARASYGSDKTFAVSIVESYEITLPYNQPKLMAEVGIKLEAMPADIVSFAGDPPLLPWTPVRHAATMGRNIWVPTSLYWAARTRINLPYLPYFSNCKGYGSTIPLWALMEQHFACELVPNEETFWMTDFSFGLAPVADGCEEVIIQCVYDEIFVSQ